MYINKYIYIHTYIHTYTNTKIHTFISTYRPLRMPMRTSSVGILDHELLFEGGFLFVLAMLNTGLYLRGSFYSEVGLLFEDLRYLYFANYKITPHYV